jgi:hypothetical protein
MLMRQVLAAAAATALLVGAGSASAAVTLTDGEAGGTAVHSIPKLSAETVTGTIGTDGEVVTLTALDNTITTSGGGASTYSGPFDEFLISFLTGKLTVGFNLEFYNPPGNDATQTTGFSVYVNDILVGSRPNPLGPPQKYILTASDGDTISTVKLLFDPNFIGAVKQIRVTGEGVGSGTDVPEPGAWALMILGFGAAGSMIRRRKVVLA